MIDIESSLKDDDSIQSAAKVFGNDIVASKLNLTDFVASLGATLTSTETEIRAKAMQLLSSTLSNLPTNFLNDVQLEFISTFCCDRFKDHHSVLPNTLSGTETLVKMSHLSDESSVRLLQAIFKNVSCQSQLRQDRLKIYNIISELTSSKTHALINMGPDLVYGFINAMDGERDPRLLIVLYDFFPKFVNTFTLGHLSQEAFEVIACYFPIDFNPIKNESEDITRDLLAGKLSNCLCAHEDFAEDCIDLLVEKLDSELSVAKIDSLNLLSKAAAKFKPEVFDQHFEDVWRLMQTDLLPGTNKEVTIAALDALQMILINMEKDPKVLENILTFIIGRLQSWFVDVDSRMFIPSSAIALKCSETNKLSAKMFTQRCLTDFLPQMIIVNGANEPGKPDRRVQVGTLIELIAQMIGTCIRFDIANEIDDKLLEAAQVEFIKCLEPRTIENEKLIKTALQALSIVSPIVTDTHRGAVYERINSYLLESNDQSTIDCSNILSSFAARYPDEVSSQIVSHLLNIYQISQKLSAAAIADLFKVLCCLIPIRKFRDEILDFLFFNIFEVDNPAKSFIRLIGARVLHHVLENDQNEQLHEEMFTKYHIFDRFFTLILSKQFVAVNSEKFTENDDLLYEMSQILRIVIKDLDAETEKQLVEKHLPSLNLQLKADLYFALGLLGYLETTVDLENHFEKLVDELTQLSLHSDDEAVTKVSNQLLCSLFNKCPDNNHHKNILKKIIDLIKKELKTHNKKAVEVLSWISKGLMARGHSQASELIDVLIELLEHPTFAEAAVAAFEVLSIEFPQLHLPVVKHLFKQKLFQICLKGLWHKLEKYSENHLSAFIFVLKMTPHQAIRNNIGQIGPILFKCLLVNKEKVILTALTIIERLVNEQEQYYRDNVKDLIDNCIKLSNYKASMKIRLAALQILSALTKEYTAIYLLPHAQDVVLGLKNALDDHKRLVRNAAVLARNQWYLVGTEK